MKKPDSFRRLPSSPSSQWREWVILAVGVVSVLGVGGWYVERTAAENLRYSDTEEDFAEYPMTTATSTVDPLALMAGARGLEEGAFEDETAPVNWSLYWRPWSAAEAALYEAWERPPGPLRVGVQPGHHELEAVPAELAGLQASTGAVGGGTSEATTALRIARLLKEALEAEGVVVDLLPATIPVDYAADAFVSIHADGNANPAAAGFKIAGPRRDFSGEAERLVATLYDTYERATGLPRDPHITRRMSGYYAFNWRRYEHAVHPRTPAVIIETGFMTNRSDRAVIVAQPERAAAGIAAGLLSFLASTTPGTRVE